MSEIRAVAPKVTFIPATLDRFTAVPINSTRRKRVAAYARVSTNSEEQQTSYDAQVSYYTDFIHTKPEWIFVKVYTDKGITGTNTKKREGFNTMIEDALAGKIDLIITKSVSRFARNTVDSLTTIRLLKEHGIEVYFEEQNIYTLDSKGELLLTIMSSIAQEESRSISENVTWGQRKRFADGKVSMPYKHFLGYRKGEDGEPEIVEEEAIVVRKIYRLFLEGYTPITIARLLTAEKIPSPAGKSKWSPSTILSILQNEKYKGDALLQKTFCTDFLTKKMKVNEGEVPQYYVASSHPAIVSVEMHDLVQEEIALRKAKDGQHSGKYLFSGKLVCSCCGSHFGRKVWHSNDPYRCVIWRCNAKFSNEEKCSTPHVTEENVQKAFVMAVNKLLGNKDEFISDCRMLMNTLGDTKEILVEIDQLEEEMCVTEGLLRKAIEKNARVAMDQNEYKRQYDSLYERYERSSEQLLALNKELLKRKTFNNHMKHFIATLAESDVVTEFSENSWRALVDTATVMPDGSYKFNFKNGMTIAI